MAKRRLLLHGLVAWGDFVGARWEFACMRGTIVVASQEEATPLELQALQHLASMWPGGASAGEREQLNVERMHLAQLLRRLSNPDPIRCPSDEAVLLIAGKRADVLEVDRCVEALQDEGIGLVLVAEDAGHWRPYADRGVIVLDAHAEPLALASMLFSLCVRQGVVSTLMREVAIMQRCQAGVRGEVERLHEELHMASVVQKEFTASNLPSMEAFGLGVLYRPVNAVSGDIYNVRQLDDDNIAFFLADAVGHGVPAALLTMILTNSLITADQLRLDKHGRPERLSPAEVLARLNQRLVEGSLHTGRFATALYGMLNLRTRVVTVAGAGHPSPFVLGEDASGGVALRELATEGPLLGVFQEAVFDQTTTTLMPGESLVLYTDGLEAAFPRLRVAGEPARLGIEAPHVQQLVSLLRNYDNAVTGMGQLEAMLDEQVGSLHQADDITVVTLSALRQVAAQRLAA